MMVRSSVKGSEGAIGCCCYYHSYHHNPITLTTTATVSLPTLTQSIRCDIESSLPARHGVVISRKIDCAINELMDTFIQNNISPWYTSIVSDPTPSIETLRLVWNYI